MSAEDGGIASTAKRDTVEEQASIGLLLTKLHPPPVRSQTVVRERLFGKLQARPDIKLTVVAAPAGAGKTTLLGTWRDLEAVRRPIAWVTLDEGDNDPVVLWAHALEALRRVCPALDGVRRPEVVGPGRIINAVLLDVVNRLTEEDDVALILDDFHRLAPGPSRESIAWLAENAPPPFQLVISTRSEPALPIASLRAHGALLELRADELGFTVDEAELLLNHRLKLELDGAEIDRLVERTEGWSAGLYLAALSLQGAADPHALVSRFGADSRHVVDFLVDEVLDAHEPAFQTLMLRSSILERISGSLCDAVLDQVGSAEQLDDLARTNMFLRPLDDQAQWYRFHHLFARLLRAELERREPGLAPMLHRRAYAWHRDHGSVDEAVEHAIQAGAFVEAGKLIATRWIEFVNVCRYASVLAWLERFPTEVLEADAFLLEARAWVLSLSARREDAALAIDLAERLDGLDRGPTPSGATSVQASLATLRAAMPWGDVGAGYASALRAAELEQPGSPLWPTVCWAHGMGHFFRDELTEAEPWFAEAERSAPAVDGWIILGSALAYQSLIAGERRDIARQRRLADDAMHVARQHGVDAIDGEAHIALGVSLAEQGEMEEALPVLEEGVAVLRAYGQPIDLAHALIRHARVLRSTGENTDAASAIAEARAIVDSCPDPGVLEDWVAMLERSPREPTRQGDGELSQRELAVLRALTGPLSEREIGRELYLSHNTVHSHTRSIYRKLGVTSRSEAIAQARKLGLL